MLPVNKRDIGEVLITPLPGVISVEVYTEKLKAGFFNLSTDICNYMVVAPANDICRESIIRIIEDIPLAKDRILVFDRNPPDTFPVPVHKYSVLSEYQIGCAFIISTAYAIAIQNIIEKAGVSRSAIIKLVDDGSLSKALPVKMIAGITLRGGRSSCEEILSEWIGEDRLLVILAGYWYDLQEKSRIFREDVGGRVVWVCSVGSPLLDPETGDIKASFPDLIRFILSRNNQENIYILILHGLTYCTNALIRYLIPKLKIISYVYDWIEHTVPYEHRYILSDQLGLGGDYVESLYYAAQCIRKGKWCDFILYKDHGAGFFIYKDAAVPAIFFPTKLPNQLNQRVGLSTADLTRILFIGTLFSPTIHDQRLAGHCIFFQAFKALSDQGLSVDVFYMKSRTPAPVVNEYLEYFKHDARVKIVEGRPLDTLIPDLGDKYDWGYMIAADDFGISEEHARHTLPSRIYAYFALGLPILVSPEFEALVKMIECYGIGIVVDRKDLSYLNQILMSVDYAAMRMNVLRYRDHIFEEKEARQRYTDIFFES